MRFSYAMLPDYSLEESLRAIELADELGFYAVYAADETWHKDLWLLFAAAAARTSRVRMGPSVSSVTLREPTLIAQAAATLDELTGGRAEVVLSSGNFGLLAQYKMDWKQMKPSPGPSRASRSSARCSTTARSPSTASSSSTTGCSPLPGRSRSTCR